MAVCLFRRETAVADVGNTHVESVQETYLNAAMMRCVSAPSSPTPVVSTFGYHDLSGARSWVLSTGLSEEGCTVVSCHTNRRGFFAKHFDLWRQFRSRLRPTAVLVMFPGQYILPLAWLLTRRPRVPLILDAFISVYDTKVHDRGIVKRFSFHALFLWLLDWAACKLSDIILIDTNEHAAYFIRTFRVSPEKMLVIPIGCRSDLFVPAKEPRFDDHPFTVVFHGTFIPLQGIDTILRAAALLQAWGDDTRFDLIGKGQTYDAMVTLATELSLQNVTFQGLRSPAEVVTALQYADCALGIFGRTNKARRVIPHKAYEILACGRPLITGDTPSARATFHDAIDALLTPCSDPKALAEAILSLKRDPVLARRIAECGHQLSLERYSPATIVAPLSLLLRQL